MTTTERFSKEAHEQIQSPLHEGLLGLSDAITEVRAIVERLAPSNLTVLLVGESGTGKDIAARILHRNSPRLGKPFIKVNCPSIPESILESELFGYERGAFTGARTSKPGRLELANAGTIFLDEIAETSYTVQSKLLQVLDGEPFMRIGGTTPIKTDVRIIAATNVSLEDAVHSGRMREDMYFRLSEVIVRMPPLRERPEDIPLLAEHFNWNFSQKSDRPYEPIPDDLMRQVQSLPLSGNVRELAARVKKYATGRDPRQLLAEETIGRAPGPTPLPASRENGHPSHAAAIFESPEPPDAHPAPGGTTEREFIPLKEATRRAVEETERRLIMEALQYTLWNRRKAAKLLRISYSSLLRRIDQYNLGRNDGD